jgi:hypothetical protein
MAVTGCNFVRFTRHGLQSIRHPWPKVNHRFKVRRQALKLRFWDERHRYPAGILIDLTYEKIKALKDEAIYELRLTGMIGGQSNIRVVFFDPPKDWIPLVPYHVGEDGQTMRAVWVIEAMPKKRNEWTEFDLDRFSGSRLLIQKRFYEE